MDSEMTGTTVTGGTTAAGGLCLPSGASLTESAVTMKITGTEEASFTASLDPSESIGTWEN